MNANGMFKPALIGGVALGILSSIPGISLFNCFCCAWVIGGGILAAGLYVKAAPAMVTLGSGAGLGLLTGAIGAVVYMLFTIPLTFLVSGGPTGFLDETRRSLGNVPNLPPWLREGLGSMPTAGTALVTFVIFALLITLAIFALMGMAGGVLGVAIFEKRKPQDRSPFSSPPINLPPAEPPASDRRDE